MSVSKQANESRPSVLIDNSGQPIKLSELQLNGVSAEAARNGETVKIWTRLCLTSDDRLFHRIADGLNGHIEHVVRRAGQAVNLKHAHTVLLVIHPDNTGDLWVDTAAVTIRIMPKRDLVAGGIVFESDIADVTEMAFPLVAIEKEDRAVCIFREGWRFGLFFDFNPAGDFSVADMQRDLGTMHRRLRYRDLYDALADTTIFSRLVEAGWFPFVEIMGSEFRVLADFCEAGFDLAEEEARLVTKFDSARLEHMSKRWMVKSHFAGKEPLLRSAVRAFLAGDAVPVIKIVLTEIEGILAEAYRAIHGKGARLPVLLDFAITSAEQKAGQADTLLFPAAFAHYLKSHTFANFDPATNTGKASSRHAVGHGAANAESYTPVRALQALLTLDQLAFYT